jgi:hypothetical protein
MVRARCERTDASAAQVPSRGQVEYSGEGVARSTLSSDAKNALNAETVAAVA